MINSTKISDISRIIADRKLQKYLVKRSKEVKSSVIDSMLRMSSTTIKI